MSQNLQQIDSPKNKYDNSVDSLLLLRTPKSQVAKISCAYFHREYRGLGRVPIHQLSWYDVIDPVDPDETPPPKRFLKLAPRDHGKTEVFSITYPLYRIIQDPNIRILILSKTSPQARKCLRIIKNELETNERIKRDFENLRGFPWGQDAIYCRRSRQSKDPTVEVVGALGSITGGHFDLIVADDICDDENTKTAQRRADMLNWFLGTILQLAEPTSQVIVVGTRKNPYDLYSNLLENPLWKCDVESAIIEWPKEEDITYIRNEEGQIVDVEVKGSYKVLWPEKWGIEALLLDRLAIGSILFNREKQNKTHKEGTLLKRDWLHFVGRKEIPKLSDLRIYMGIDLAISESEQADYTTIAVAGVSQYDVYLLKVYRVKLDFPQQIEAIKAYAKQWRPVCINIESNAYQLAMHQHLFATTPLPVRASKTLKDKMSRFVGMSANFENGRIRIAEDIDEEFIKEWTEFPDSKHDDYLDAVEKVLEVSLRGEIQIW